MRRPTGAPISQSRGWWRVEPRCHGALALDPEARERWTSTAPDAGWEGGIASCWSCMFVRQRRHACQDPVIDLTASGFFSSELGVQDLQYQGNTFVMEWQGCPPEALAKLGVSYPS